MDITENNTIFAFAELVYESYVTFFVCTIHHYQKIQYTNTNTTINILVHILIHTLTHLLKHSFYDSQNKKNSIKKLKINYFYFNQNLFGI